MDNNNDNPLSWTGRQIWLRRTPSGDHCTAGTIIGVRPSILKRGQFDVWVQIDGSGGVTVVEAAERGSRWDFDRRAKPRTVNDTASSSNGRFT
jgi:hypothetical protein